MNSPWIFLLVTTGLIAASAFFVAVEFALIAARRSRLEDAAPHSRAARAALRSASELSVLLAGSPTRHHRMHPGPRRSDQTGGASLAPPAFRLWGPHHG